MKVVSIVGARPQFIKSAPVSQELRQVAQEILVHTGQHYDDAMSGVFFRDLNLPDPDYHLGVGSGTQAHQTGEMLKKIEEVLLREKPECVLVYGDTNSTLAGALAAAKLHIPVAHVEAGLRSFNRRMPEEINRVMTDHLSALLLCPTETAVRNLDREGVSKGVHLIGDVMYDAFLNGVEIATKSSTILDRLKLRGERFVVATVHRAENTDQFHRLEGIVTALVRLAEAGRTVVFPVHPRTRKQLSTLSFKHSDRFMHIEPVSFLDMMALQSRADLILTDSGGIQKEAHWLRIPCLTLRDDTEWVETVESGWNRLVGADPQRILQAFHETGPGAGDSWPWKRGEASRAVAQLVGAGAWG